MFQVPGNRLRPGVQALPGRQGLDHQRFAVDQKSVAVLPFLDLTEGMHEEEFADGMTQELIDKLFVAADAFAGGAMQHDDMTLLIVRVLPAG